MAQAAETTSVVPNKLSFFKKHAVKTKYGLDRVVEDLIQEAMSKGDFDNLTGYGKPLGAPTPNPYVDFTQQKINKILADNGFSPEWILLNKEIREKLQELSASLRRERAQFASDLSDRDAVKWQCVVGRYESVADEINDKIDKYNILVPIMNKQMVHVRLGRIADGILGEHPQAVIDTKGKSPSSSSSSSSAGGDNQKSLFSLISSIF